MKLLERLKEGFGSEREISWLEKEILTDDDASAIIEWALDTLIEVGNGTTDQCLHDTADYLFAFRDKWFNRQIERAQ